MKVPRDLSGERLAALLARHGYEASRQTGSHMRLTSTQRASEHHVTIPRHGVLRVGTLSAILAGVCAYLEMSREELLESLFDR